jgi:hypothetical protein
MHIFRVFPSLVNFLHQTSVSYHGSDLHRVATPATHGWRTRNSGYPNFIYGRIIFFSLWHLPVPLKSSPAKEKWAWSLSSVSGNHSRRRRRRQQLDSGNGGCGTRAHAAPYTHDMR